METNNISNIITIFFEKLNIQIDSLEVQKEEEHIFYIKLQTPDSSLLIGYSWKTLEDIRLILTSLLRQFSWEKTLIHLEINDYLIKKDEKLFDFVRRKAEIVQRTGQEITLPFFNAYERKKIHSFILTLNDESLSSKSIWEGKDRKITLYKKINHLKNIDLDAIDI